MAENIIPYIGGEEEKSEQEPMKVWGRVENGVIVKNGGAELVEAINEKGFGSLKTE